MADDRDVLAAVVESLLHRLIERQALGAFAFNVNPSDAEDIASTFFACVLNRPIDRASLHAQHANQFPRKFPLTACAFIALHLTHRFPPE